MFKPRKSWILVVLPALLAGVLAMASGGDAEAATTHKVTIPAADFDPTTDNWDYSNGGYRLIVVSGFSANFVAPVPILGDSANITSVRLHYYDNGTSDICATLYRAKPSAGTERAMAQVCSSGAEDKDRSRITTSISPSYTGPNHGPYLWVTIPEGGSYYKLYGVTVTYTTR